MNTELLYKINKRLSTLQNILVKIIPIDKMKLHPTKYFDQKYIEILNCMDHIIKNSEQEFQKINLECISLFKEIELKCSSLNLKIPEIPNFINYNLKREYLLNELCKIKIFEKEVIKEIDLWIIKISEIYLEVYNLTFKQNKQINLKFLLYLKNEHKKIKEEKFRKEKNRGKLTKKIKQYCKLLEITPVIVTKISELEEKYNSLSLLVKERDRQISFLKSKIVNKESLLEIHATSFITSLSKEYLDKLTEYLTYLEEEYKRKINEIYNSHVKKLKDLLDLFGMENEVYEKNNEGLILIKNRITDLELKKDAFLEINNLIEKRFDLLESMSEFEKIASDPKRLFKSSFQLNKEEKFRKNAFPSLLNIESVIFNKISKYNQKYDKFYKEGKDFENEMKREIDNRIINKSVFIQKFDSPYKKRT